MIFILMKMEITNVNKYKMSLTPEQLMIPRVMCIGTQVGKPNYPGSVLKTGEILVLSKSGFSYRSDSDNYIKEEWVKIFPNLFRPMPWHEGRTAEEMPLYLKHGENGKVRKVARYFNWGAMIVEFEGGRTRRLTDKWIPCTEAEYISYQKSKQ